MCTIRPAARSCAHQAAFADRAGRQRSSAQRNWPGSRPARHADAPLRRAQATLTDGRRAEIGCVNTTTGRACSPQEDAVESFTLAPGERLTALWLWSGPSGAGVPNYRAGAIRLSTSLVRPPPHPRGPAGEAWLAQQESGCHTDAW